MAVRQCIVECGDPHVDEAWCSCGQRLRPASQIEQRIWAKLHAAAHEVASLSNRDEFWARCVQDASRVFEL